MDRAGPTLFRRSNLLGGLLLLVAVAAGPAFAVLINFQHELRRERTERAQTVAVQQAQLVSASVGEAVEGTRQMLVALSAAGLVHDLDPACADVLRELRRLAPAYGVLAVMRRDGTPVCSDAAAAVPTDVMVSLAQPFLSVTGFVTGRYTSMPAIGPPMLTFALPLQVGDGAGPAILIAGLDLGRLGMLLAGLDRPKFGRFVVADRDGTVLADAPDQTGRIGRPVAPEQRDALQAKSAGAMQYRGENGDQQVIGYVPPGLDPAALFVCAASSVAGLVGGIDAAANRGYLLIVLGAALSVLLALIIGHRYLRVPASVLLAAARRWGSGDLSAGP
jgi:hypothetical protein